MTPSDENLFLKNLPRISLKHRKRVMHQVNSIENTEHKENITLLFVGKTGDGKTTTINSMMNYLFDTEFEGDRYQLIDETHLDKKKTQSQTENVTVYHISPTHPDINYNITIVDTPGFVNCDDKGKEFDKEIGNQLLELFRTKVTEINAICLVMNSLVTRITDEQSYVFSQFADKFAKNIQENIMPLFTFDDGSRPPISLNAVEETKICQTEKYCVFNNRGFEFDEDKPDYSKQQQFDHGMKVFGDFFRDITVPKPQSLEFSAEQLTRKAQLREIIQNFSEEFDKALEVCSFITNRMDNIKANKDLIDAGSKTSITWEFAVTSKERVKAKRWVKKINLIAPSAETNKKENENNSLVSIEEFISFYVCDQCEVTVNQGWFDSLCKRSPKCPSGHITKKKLYTYKQRMVKKKVNIKQLISGYYDSTLNEPLSDQMINNQAAKLKKIECELIELMCKLKNGINHIQTIALDTTDLTIDRYLSILVEDAMHSSNPNKVNALKRLQQQAKLIEEIDKQIGSISIFPEVESINIFVEEQEQKENDRIAQKSLIDQVQKQTEALRAKKEEVKKKKTGMLWWAKEELIYNLSYRDILQEFRGHVLNQSAIEHKDLLETDVALECCKLLCELKKSNSTEQWFKVAENTSEHCTKWMILQSNYVDEAYKIYLMFGAGLWPELRQNLCHPPKTCIGLAEDVMVHKELHSSMHKDFIDIWNEIENLQAVTEVNIIGRATGGGLAILFGFEMIQRGKLKIDNSNDEKSEDRTYNIVTFGAAPVFACKKNFQDIAKKIQNDAKLKALHDICHCYVNRLDLIPRLIHLIATNPIVMTEIYTTAYDKDRVMKVANVPASKMYFAIGKQYIWCGQHKYEEIVAEEMRVRTKHDIHTSFNREWGKVPPNIWKQMEKDNEIENYLDRLKSKFTLT